MSSISKRLNESVGTFKRYYESDCNICANELKPGDTITNINPECEHYKSKGTVSKITKIPQDKEKTAGNIVVYIVSNNSKDLDSSDLNGTFSVGDELAKTEIQLKKDITTGLAEKRKKRKKRKKSKRRTSGLYGGGWLGYHYSDHGSDYGGGDGGE
jgi:hypothetical protein